MGGCGVQQREIEGEAPTPQGSLTVSVRSETGQTEILQTHAQLFSSSCVDARTTMVTVVAPAESTGSDERSIALERDHPKRPAGSVSRRRRACGPGSARAPDLNQAQRYVTLKRATGHPAPARVCRDTPLGMHLECRLQRGTATGRGGHDPRRLRDAARARALRRPLLAVVGRPVPRRRGDGKLG